MKRLIILPLYLVLFFTAAAQNVEFTKRNFPDDKKGLKEALNNIKEGDKHFEKGVGAFHLAKIAYLKAQDFNPNNAQLNFKIGVCYFASLSNEKATSLEYFEKAYALDKQVDVDIEYYLAQAYQANLQFDKALNFYQKYKSSLNKSDLESLEPIINKRIQECKNGKEILKNPVKVKIKNLGPDVNSNYREHSPLISADESLLIFTSRRSDTKGGRIDPNDLLYFEDVYQSTKNKEGKFTSATPIDEINTKEHDATVGLFLDGQKMLLYKDMDIYESKLNGNKWSKPKKLGKEVNSKHGEFHACYNYNGTEIYFVSDRPGGLGGKDIYVTKKLPSGEWGEPENLGTPINTDQDEHAVFMHADGKTMYFSSRGHKTMGGYDIFKSVNENGKWSVPVNVGYPINTPGDDVFLVFSASGKRAYYSSLRADEGYGESDIYSIIFITEKNPIVTTEDNFDKLECSDCSELTILKGIIYDEKTNDPVEANIEIVDNTKNEIIATIASNSSTGRYMISLPSGKNYGIAVKAERYLFHSENFDIPHSAGYQEVEKNIPLKSMEVGNKVVLKNIFFDFNKASLRKESYPELDRLKKLLEDNPTMSVEISGHTDNVGSAAYNERLSTNRAKVVVEYLVEKGIDPSRLTYKGYGFSQPIAPNDTDEGRQLNRRTEFKVTGIK